MVESAGVSDGEILARLAALNAERAAEEQRGHTRCHLGVRAEASGAPGG